MDDSLAQQAINHALNGNWEKAKDINLQILKSDQKDIEALNRLARAYFELNNISKAKQTSAKVLKIDPFNNIAQKSIEKWSGLKKFNKVSSKTLTANSFLEEPGKTKTVNLIHLGDKSIIAGLDAGDVVVLNTHAHRICVSAESGDHIGKIPDDLSIHLRKYIKLGYCYSAYVKSIDSLGVKIFIKESHRPKNYSQLPSFTSEKFSYISYTPPELVHEKPKISYGDGEEDTDESSDSVTDTV